MGSGDGRSSEGRLPAYVEELLAAERTAPAPSRRAQDRVRARIAASVVAAGAVGAVGAVGAATSAAGATVKAAGAVGSAMATKTALIVVAIAAAGATATGGIVMHQHRVQLSAHATVVAGRARQPAAVGVEIPARSVPPRALPQDDPQPPAPTRAAPHPAAEVGAAARVARHPIAVPARADDHAAPSATGLTAENVPIAAALAALARHAPADAIAALQRHASRFPDGQLEEEREALWIQALVAAGEGVEARARGDRFRRRFPGSIQQEVVAAALATIH